MRNPKKTSGLTLIEILFSCVVFIICIVLLVKTFTAMTNSYVQGHRKVEIQNAIRTSLDIISDELRECYGPDSANFAIYNPGPNSGNSVKFNKRDERKSLGLNVYYVYQENKKCMMRRDQSIGSSTPLSVGYFGQYIESINFSRSSSTSKTVTIDVHGKNPTNGADISFSTSITMRSGEEMCSLASLGKNEGSGSSGYYKPYP